MFKTVPVEVTTKPKHIALHENFMKMSDIAKQNHYFNVTSTSEMQATCVMCTFTAPRHFLIEKHLPECLREYERLNRRNFLCYEEPEPKKQKIEHTNSNEEVIVPPNIDIVNSFICATALEKMWASDPKTEPSKCICNISTHTQGKIQNIKQGINFKFCGVLERLRICSFPHFKDTA